jgi:CheY-like chemotaxis protein
MKILIADDNQEAAEAIKKFLTRKGYSPDTAFDGKEALDLIKINNYDLVLLDHDMPEMTGLELLDYIKKNNPEMKIVMITGYTDMEGSAAKGMGADEYLTKPLDMLEIEKIIEKYRNTEN